MRFSSFVSQGQRSAWYVSNYFCVPISFELTRACAQSISGAIYEGSVSRNLLQGGSLVSPSAATDFQRVAIAVGAIRVGSVQIAARVLANANSTSHTQDVWIMCAPCLGSALLVRCTLIILDWSTLTSYSFSQLSLFSRPTPLPASAAASAGSDIPRADTNVKESA